MKRFSLFFPFFFSFFSPLLAFTLFFPLLSYAGAPAGSAKSGTPVTVTRAIVRPVEVTEEAIGRVISLAYPQLAAEVSGRVSAIRVDEGAEVSAGLLLAEVENEEFRNALAGAKADIARLTPLIAFQAKTVERYRNLLREKVLPPERLEDAESILIARHEELNAARSRLAEAERRLEKCRITSPVSGRVVRRLISLGDFVQPGKPLFQIVTEERMRLVIPFPEGVSTRIQPGLTVHLTALAQPQREVQAPLLAVRPVIASGSKALEAIVELDNPGGWLHGGAVRALVVIERHPQAVMIPLGAVVPRPAGSVVYRPEQGKAVQQMVTTGVEQGGMVEILTGLSAGEPVIVDGAGFLTDQAAILVREEKTP